MLITPRISHTFKSQLKTLQTNSFLQVTVRKPKAVLVRMLNQFFLIHSTIMTNVPPESYYLAASLPFWKSQRKTAHSPRAPIFHTLAF